MVSRNKSILTFLPTNLLLIAGFLVMLALGIVDRTQFVFGAVLWIAGMAASIRLSDEGRQATGYITIAMLAVNMVLYSSKEVFPFIDVSLAIYALCAAELGLLAWGRASAEGTKAIFPYIGQVAAYLTAVALSAIDSSHRKEVIYFFGVNFAAFFVFYAILNLLASRVRHMAALLKSFVLLGIVSAAAAVWQLYSHSFKIAYYPFLAGRDQAILELWEKVSRVVGTWQHPSYLGIFLSILIPLAVYLIFYESETYSEKALWAASIVFMSSVVLLTNTRSSVIAAVLGVVLVYILANMPGWRFLRRTPSGYKIAVLGLCAAASLLVYQFVFVSEIYTKPQAWRVDASATIWGRFLRSDSMSTESLVQRSQLYSLAWKTFLAHPVSGVGAKSFPYLVQEKFDKEGTDAHNLILQTLAETGILGLLAVVALYGSVAASMLRKILRTENYRARYLQAALFAVVILVLFDSMFNNPLYSLRIVAIFWIFIALQHVIYRNYSAQA